MRVTFGMYAAKLRHHECLFAANFFTYLVGCLGPFDWVVFLRLISTTSESFAVGTTQERRKVGAEAPTIFFSAPLQKF